MALPSPIVPAATPAGAGAGAGVGAVTGGGGGGGAAGLGASSFLPQAASSITAVARTICRNLLPMVSVLRWRSWGTSRLLRGNLQLLAGKNLVGILQDVL